MVWAQKSRPKAAGVRGGGPLLYLARKPLSGGAGARGEARGEADVRNRATTWGGLARNVTFLLGEGVARA